MRCRHKAAYKPRSIATGVVMLFREPQTRRYTQPTVHIQGAAHNRLFIATAAVMSFMGP